MRELLGKQKQTCVPSILTSSPPIQIKLKVTVLLKHTQFHVHVPIINLISITVAYSFMHSCISPVYNHASNMHSHWENSIIRSLSYAFMNQLLMYLICMSSMICLAYQSCPSGDHVPVVYVLYVLQFIISPHFS